MPHENTHPTTSAERFGPKDLAGQALRGRYEIIQVLGHGAMGEVLEVRDLHTETHYALKRVLPEVVRDEAQMAGVRANFNLVSGLTHTHIAATRNLEFDPRSGHAYVILDLVRGVDQWALA